MSPDYFIKLLDIALAPVVGALYTDHLLLELVELSEELGMLVIKLLVLFLEALLYSAGFLLDSIGNSFV